MTSVLQQVFGRGGGFRGGIFLPPRRETTAGMPVQSLPPPSFLCVPLQYDDGPPATPCVEVGDRVRGGDRIGRADSPDAVDVHAPLAGRITALVRVDSARRTDIPAMRLEISPDQAEQPPTPLRVPDDWDGPGLDELVQAAEAGGVTDDRASPAGLAALLAETHRRGVRHVIINALPGEPMLTAGAVLLDDHLDAIVRLAGWIGMAVGAEHTWLAVDRADGARLRRCRIAARRVPLGRTRRTRMPAPQETHRAAPVAGATVRLAPLANKYPQHVPVVLAASIVGVETPPGGTTLDVGVLVLEARTMVDLATALAWAGHEPVPMTHRVVTVTGPAVARPGHYRIPVGTRFEDVLRHVGLRQAVRRVVDGGPLTGRALGHLDVVVTKHTSGVLALDRATDRVPEPGPCVRCGWCQDDCPVGLDPQALLDLAERGDVTAATAWHPRACVECGLCSYVCPAQLPLAEGVARLKRAVSCK
ncbi:MAG: SLBB domain-containing protein [Planctomycetes bacterium]|nr:SLBB domain-containing protein [Planctomycetota bacterium]